MSKVKNIAEKIRHSYYNIMKVLGFVLTLTIVVLMMPRNVKFKYEYQKMLPWQHPSLYAPFNFPIYKSDEVVRKEKEEALKNIEPIFVFDALGTENGREKLLKDFDNQWNDTIGDKDFYENLILSVYDHIENNGIVAKNDRTTNLKEEETVVVVRNKVQTKCAYGDLNTMTTASEYIHRQLSNISDYNTRQLISNLLHSSLRQNVIYSESMTKQAEKMAVDNIMLTFGMVQKDELIIMEGDIVTEEKYQIISSLQREYADIYANNFFSRNYMLYGQFLLVAMVFIALYLTIKMLRPDIYEQLRYINLILLLMLVIIVPSFLLLKYAPSFIFLMPVAIMAMLLMTFFDARISIIVQVMTLIIISLAVPNPFQFFFVQLLVSFVAVITMTKRSSRASYFGTSLAVFVTYVAVYFGMMLIYEGDFDSFDWRYLLICAGNAFFTMLTLPLAFLFERIFGFVTDLSLLELSNTNSPLLRKLASEAPGTFQHVMQVADLCEEVIYNIGGNSLLVRTGAMYHDIGKTKNPFYFIENQNGKYNPHDDVSYSESAQIIIGHVIDGIEICREYRIPEQIIDFVRTHHGTRRTEYFYQMELRENPDGVDERDFCYHGPVPFSKETAVLMMCDAVEAASRSMNDKTEESICKLVDNIIDGQMKAHQFDNTNITFHDISITKKVLKKKLMSIYHVRIAYPD
ncbi:MAG: HDIG domain-containing protein [Bacteroidales bacterium]|nr:HDIG domain-containing protein [Bacteroidales bacterium]